MRNYFRQVARPLLLFFRNARNWLRVRKSQLRSNFRGLSRFHHQSFYFRLRLDLGLLQLAFRNWNFKRLLRIITATQRLSLLQCAAFNLRLFQNRSLQFGVLFVSNRFEIDFYAIFLRCFGPVIWIRCCGLLLVSLSRMRNYDLTGVDCIQQLSAMRGIAVVHAFASIGVWTFTFGYWALIESTPCIRSIFGCSIVAPVNGVDWLRHARSLKSVVLKSCLALLRRILLVPILLRIFLRQL